MNDVKFTVKKLESLLTLATSCNTELEKCSVFAAGRLLIDDLEAHFIDDDAYILEQINKIKWSFSAMTGFDISNSHTAQQHYEWALGSFMTLNSLINRS